MADTFLGTSWTGALPPWLPIGWEQPRGMHRSLPMESRGSDLQLLSQRHKVAIVLSLKKRGMEQECRKKPITLSFPSLFVSLSLCPSLSLPLPSLHYSVVLLPSLSFALLTLPSHASPVALSASGFSIEPGKEAETVQAGWGDLSEIPHVSGLRD